MRNIDEMKESFSKGFNNFLSRKELKVLDVAEKTGMKQSTVSCWKTKRSLPDFEKITNLFEMGMTIHEIFGDELGEKIISNSILARGTKDISQEKVKALEDRLVAIQDNYASQCSEIQKELEENLKQTQDAQEKTLKLLQQMFSIESPNLPEGQRTELSEKLKEVSEGIEHMKNKGKK